MKWTKASELLPDEMGKHHWRDVDTKLPISTGGAFVAIKHGRSAECEWLDETESPSDSEAVELKPSVERLVEELRKDKGEGGYYYGWQSNIAMAFFDQFLNDHEGVLTQRQLSEVSNKAAKRFLDQLTYEPCTTNKHQ